MEPPRVPYAAYALQSLLSYGSAIEKRVGRTNLRESSSSLVGLVLAVAGREYLRNGSKSAQVVNNVQEALNQRRYHNK